jgi:subtilisin family serine protease
MTTLRLSLLLVLAAACGHHEAPVPAPPRPAPAATTPAPAVPASAAPVDATPVAPPRLVDPTVPAPLALLAGLMPLKSTGIEDFRSAHPTYDGRGVVIGILDSGIDPGVAGLIVTTTGAPKVADLRDFSGEGRVALRAVTPGADGSLVIAGRTLRGAARVGRLAVGTTWYAGVFRELALGTLPAADVNGNGTNTDAFPLVVVKASDGWVVFFDSNLNGSFEDEQPLHDYRQGRETIALGKQPLTLAANFAEADGVPDLDLYFDTWGHGTHVAGIAGGHWLYGVAGFDGVAPGAQILGLKIANDARGAISTSGSMRRAMDYAVRYAAERGLPLVLNLSYDVGNERAGRAAIDSLINAFLLAHPNVVMTISAGNDGPGLSTVEFPGSADLALSVGALEPGAFTRQPQAGPPPPDRMGWWSSRGGATAKPDVVAPGQAYSTVPRWNTGDEIKAGTSMAAPQMAGFTACLLSAMAQEHRPVSAADLLQAVRATAVRLAGWTDLDQGAGVPRIEAAYRWLSAGHQGSRYFVRTQDGTPAAMRRNGFAGPGDTLQTFMVVHADGLRAAQFLLTSNAPWLTVPPVITSQPRATAIPVRYRADLLKSPGVYVATVTARSPSDSFAGPLFTITSSVIVPVDLGARALNDSARVIGPGRVQRYFLRAPVAGTALRVTASVPDPDDGALIQVYDPDGHPASADPDSLSTVGYGKAPTVVIETPAEDMLPGVYEVDVFNPGKDRVTVSVQAQLASVALTTREDGVLEVSNSGASSTTVTATAGLAGAERQVEVAGSGSQAESLAVAVPAWAVRGEVFVRMPVGQWEQLTDFGITLFDSAGQQVHSSALNYSRGRMGFDVPGYLAGHTTLLELFPAFARSDTAPAWSATVRLRFFGDSLLATGPGHLLDVVAGGRAVLPAVTVPPLSLPDGFLPLLQWRLTPAAGSGAAAVTYAPVRAP